MPTYDYRCAACGHDLEVFQSIHDPVLRKCPKCKKAKLERLIGPGAGILFKGGGFYQTDYRSENYKRGESAETGSGQAAAESSAPKDGTAPKDAAAPKVAASGEDAAAPTDAAGTKSGSPGETSKATKPGKSARKKSD